MKKITIVISIIIGINYSCISDNKINSGAKTQEESPQVISNVVKMDGYYSESEVDTLPVFEYKNLKRQIQPRLTFSEKKPRYLRDSLLSVFLEDSLLGQAIGCEGVFLYEIILLIDSNGSVNDIKFVKDDFKIKLLKKYILHNFKRIKLTPAKINGKYVPIFIQIAVKIDLYTVPSDIKRKLFPFENYNSNMIQLNL